MGTRDSNTHLITFLQNFSKLTEDQLLSVRQTMETAVETVMKGVEAISSMTDGKRKEAEKVLEATYVNPDAETEVLILDMQRVVDDLFDQSTEILAKGSSAGKDITSLEHELLVRNRINRVKGKFQGDMDSLNQLDEELGNLLFGIIGTLSAEDVIAQKIDHVIMSLQALQTGLNYVLIDFECRGQPEPLERIMKDIKDLSFRQYTTEDEKDRFRYYFGTED